MTPERQRYWQQYVDDLRPLMELRDWSVELQQQTAEEKTGSEDSLANIECIYGRKLANLTLSSKWEEYPPEDQRLAIVHELVHCHLTGAGDTVNDGMLALHLGDTGYRILKNAFLRHFEYGVDAIATGWADALPLPPGDHSMPERAVEELFDLEPGSVKPPDVGADGWPRSRGGVTIDEAPISGKEAREELLTGDPLQDRERMAKPMGEITDPAIVTDLVASVRVCTGCEQQLPDEVPCHFASTCPGKRPKRPIHDAPQA